MWRLCSPSVLTSKLSSGAHILPHPVVAGNDWHVMASRRGVHWIPLPVRERQYLGGNGGLPEVERLVQSSGDP